MAVTKKKSKPSPTPKSKASAKSSATAKKKSTTSPRKAAKPSKGIVAKGKAAVVEVVATIVGGAIAGAAQAGTTLVEKKSGSVKKSVESKSAGDAKMPAKKRTAAAK